MNRTFLCSAGLVTLAVLAACGGGGGSGSTSVPAAGGGASTSSTPAALATATAPALSAGQAAVNFTISKSLSSSSSSSTRRAQTIAPNTQSITLTLLSTNNVPASNATAQGPFAIATSAPGCTTSGNTLTCAFSIAAPIGTDIFLANTFSSTNAAVGTALGSGAVRFVVVQNAANNANLTLTGPIQSVAAVSNNGANLDTLWNGYGVFLPITASQVTNYQSAGATPSPEPSASSSPAPVPSERVYLIAQDSSGNVILNPTTYNQPIQLTLNLNGGPANVTLTDTPPSGLSCGGPTTATTNQSFVDVCTPSDVVTISTISAVLSPPIFGGFLNANFPSLTATLASPPSGFTPFPFPFTIENGAPTASLPVVGE